MKNFRPNLASAPMAGYTDSAFRQICKEIGADIVMTELISADALFHNKKLNVCHPEQGEGSREPVSSSSEDSSLSVQNDNMYDFLNTDKTLSLLRFDEAERPIVVQLFGKYPEKFAFAAKWVAENIKPDGLDINMGCPARKVVGSDHGAALLKNHALAVEIVEAVREQIDIPLSVKTRLGWESDDEILEFAPKLIEAGINAIIIHGRTYKDGFKYSARWQNIYNLKSQISNLKNNEVAIIGNGDVKSYQEAIERSESNEVKLDGVAIGRASFGNPWIFRPNKLPPEADQPMAEKSYQLKPDILRHAKLAYQTKGDHGIIEFRKHLLAYIKGLPNAKRLRNEAVRIENMEDVENIIKKLL